MTALAEEQAEGAERTPGLRSRRGMLGFPIRDDDLRNPGESDLVFESKGVKIYVDSISLSYLKAAEVDFAEAVTGGGFTIKNPNAVST